MVRYQDGDVRAFEELYRKFSGPIHAFFRRRVNREEDAADLYQEAFMKLHRERWRYRPGHPFRAWLFTIARNTLYDFYRTSNRRPRTAELQEQGETVLAANDPAAQPDAVAERVDLNRRLEQAISLLPETQREVLLLREHDGLSYAEIGEVLAMSENAARQAMFRAVQHLRETLKAEDVS